MNIMNVDSRDYKSYGTFLRQTHSIDVKIMEINECNIFVISFLYISTTGISHSWLQIEEVCL